MLHTLKGNGFDRLFTLVSIKMEHPRPLQVCTNVCIIFAHTGAGVIWDKRQRKEEYTNAYMLKGATTQGAMQDMGFHDLRCKATMCHDTRSQVMGVHV